MCSNSTYITVAIATAGALGTGYYAYQYYQNNKKKLPKTWIRVGTLKELCAYPIKSCGMISLENAECTLLGLKSSWLRDRFLMVVDDKNNFITARAYPELLLVKPTIRGSILTLNHSEMETIHVNLAEVIALQKPIEATVWSVKVPVLDCGWEVSEWFSRLLQRTTHTLRLVLYCDQKSRSLRPNINRIYRYKDEDTGALPDEVSFNLINEASVEDLNTRLEHPVSARHFRPNFVLKGSAKPYDEDGWKYVKIGENVFEIIKPCTRCIMTTIDPETGVRDPKSQPLDTLKTYRQLDDPAARRSAGYAPRMGVQMALRSTAGATVALNDQIYVA